MRVLYRGLGFSGVRLRRVASPPQVQQFVHKSEYAQTMIRNPSVCLGALNPKTQNPKDPKPKNL